MASSFTLNEYADKIDIVQDLAALDYIKKSFVSNVAYADLIIVSLAGTTETVEDRAVVQGHTYYYWLYDGGDNLLQGPTAGRLKQRILFGRGGVRGKRQKTFDYDVACPLCGKTCRRTTLRRGYVRPHVTGENYMPNSAAPEAWTYKTYLAKTVLNPGFETVIDPTPPCDWANWTEVVSGTGNFYDFTLHPHSGSHAVSMYSGNTMLSYLHQTIATTASTLHLFGFWRFKTDSWPQARYAVYDVTNAAYIVPKTSIAITLEDEWYFTPVFFTTPVGCISVRLELWCSPEKYAQIYYDDVILNAFVAGSPGHFDANNWMWWTLPGQTDPLYIFPSIGKDSDWRTPPDQNECPGTPRIVINQYNPVFVTVGTPTSTKVGRCIVWVYLDGTGPLTITYFNGDGTEVSTTLSANLGGWHRVVLEGNWSTGVTAVLRFSCMLTTDVRFVFGGAMLTTSVDENDWWPPHRSTGAGVYTTGGMMDLCDECFSGLRKRVPWG
jgi:hypothetical protein